MRHIKELILEDQQFPARFGIGDKVELDFQLRGKITDCAVRAAIFEEGDVWYDIDVHMDGENFTTLYKVDSSFVVPQGEAKGVTPSQETID